MIREIQLINWLNIKKDGTLVIIKKLCDTCAVVVKEYILGSRVHSNRVLCPIAHGYDWKNQRGYLIIPYLEANDLSKCDTPTALQFAQYLSDVRKAINACHLAGVAHPSLHAKNILVYKGRCIVIDFGSSKMLTNLDKNKCMLLKKKDMLDAAKSLYNLLPFQLDGKCGQKFLYWLIKGNKSFSFRQLFLLGWISFYNVYSF